MKQFRGYVRGQNRPACDSAGAPIPNGQPERKLIAPIKNGGASMHASLAFVNGAGNKRSTPVAQTDPEGLRLLNALLSTATSESPRPTVDKGKSKDERQAEEENQADTASTPGGFNNDPDDPKNPNEVRERHLKKIKP
jgi:hypothetical protein